MRSVAHAALRIGAQVESGTDRLPSGVSAASLLFAVREVSARRDVACGWLVGRFG